MSQAGFVDGGEFGRKCYGQGGGYDYIALSRWDRMNHSGMLVRRCSYIWDMQRRLLYVHPG